MLHWKNIDLEFDGKKILKNFSLSVQAGEKVLVQGRSGLGKTTLFNLLLGFITPQKGQIAFQQLELTHKTIWQIRRQIVLVDQESSLGEGTLRTWFETVLGLQANAGKAISFEQCYPWMEQCDLDQDLLDKDISLLSGGERQRAAIVTALLLQRNIFLLDEPTASLDDTTKQTVANLFMQHPDWTVVVISHDPIWRHTAEPRTVMLEAPR